MRRDVLPALWGIKAARLTAVPAGQFGWYHGNKLSSQAGDESFSIDKGNIRESKE